MKHLILILSIAMIACSGPDCSNGIMDNNETNIDCGGDCPACVNIPTAAEQALEGMWYFHRQVSVDGITTYYTASNCKMDLTLDLWEPPTQYIAYGSVGLCNYSSKTGWWINESSGYLNDIYTYTVTADSLHIIYTGSGGGSIHSYYYK